jgi:hypothetical protein
MLFYCEVTPTTVLTKVLLASNRGCRVLSVSKLVNYSGTVSLGIADDCDTTMLWACWGIVISIIGQPSCHHHSGKTVQQA